MINRIYCVRRFPESKFEWIWDKEFLKPLVSFSGWDLFGNLSCTIYQQGTNFLINIFFGVVYNAASGIANTITGVIRNFCNNILMAFRPQIIKLYSIGEINQSVNLLYQATKLSTSLLIILIIPIIFEIDFIMNLWLKEPPPYAGVFCKLLLINACFTMIEWALSIGIHATGKIKSISIFGGLCFLLSVPILWICFKYGFPIETAYIICIPTSIIVIIVKSIIYKTYVPIFSYNNFIVTVLFPLLILALCNISGVYLSTYWISPGFLHFVVSISTDIIISIVVIYFIILNTNQREKIIKFIKFKLKINR
jgi:O-antigen/teichoic acid export membrane protein